MEAWLIEGKDPVAPTYKKSGVLIQKAINGDVVRTYTFSGLWLSSRTIQSMSLENEGEMQALEYTLKFDDILPTG